MSGRFLIWRHDCMRDGPCESICENPWQVDTPKGLHWESGDYTTTFQTLAEAMDFTQHVVRTREHLVISQQTIREALG